LLGSIAVARALSSSNLMDALSHVSTNSGSTWFMAAFSYSPSFYHHVTNMTYDIDQHVSTWFNKYVHHVQRLPSKARWQRCSTSCSARCLVEKHVLPTLIDNDTVLPILNWTAYVAELLKIIGLVRTHHMHDSRVGFAASKVILTMSVPPSEWTAACNETRWLQLSIGNSSCIASHPIPVQYVVGAQTSGWEWRKDLVMKSQGEVVKFADNPTLPHIAAASSSALGFLASPTMIRNYLRHRFSDWADTTRMSRTEQLDGQLCKCFKEDGNDFAIRTTHGDEVSYGLIDGAYTDDSAVAAAVGSLEDASNLRAAKIAIINFDKNAMISLPRLFRDASKLLYPLANSTCSPPFRSVAFDADFSSLQFRSFDGGLLWKGKLKTKANKWYNVKGGRIVSVLLLHIRVILPSIINPGPPVLGQQVSRLTYAIRKVLHETSFFGQTQTLRVTTR